MGILPPLIFPVTPFPYSLTLGNHVRKALEANACNPTTRGRGKKTVTLKVAWATSWGPCLKNKTKAGEMAHLGEGLLLQPECDLQIPWWEMRTSS